MAKKCVRVWSEGLTVHLELMKCEKRTFENFKEVQFQFSFFFVSRFIHFIDDCIRINYNNYLKF